MKRLFWIALGATAGVIIVRKVTKAAESMTPEGAADRLSSALTSVSQSIREFTDEVRAGMDERDKELREALGIADNGDETHGGPNLAAVEDLLDHNQRRGTY
ncbi:DUF6167 family protein [Phytoactinopolyspora halotolerans]|uniref:Uncharacterized protein n=1 Tax=Phytoactinopolyspora halotolerans TaxID=1981512 RepID=A0A6L9S8F8_9ACTN|nr:DUF6167 family protein [Phytoactinopolyspora halotolerans]NEE01337.1 hypothetical protein [Phytoactinopolyspora halotolerans]